MYVFFWDVLSDMYVDVSDMYVAESRVPELQHLTATQSLKNLFKDTQWTVDESL
jgi:hypothetical protein